MKKSVNKILFFLIVAIISLSPFFSGCTTKITLATPSFVSWQENSETGSQMLVTENNTKATSFLFGVNCANELEPDISNFIKFKSNTCYLDVTNIFVNAKKYYFYAQAIGSKEYLDSEISEIYSFDNKYKLAKPTIVLSGTTLSWANVQNASNYYVFSNNNIVATVETNTCDMSRFIDLSSNKPYIFKVACKENGNYLRSADSNEITYSEHLKLRTPNNLSVEVSALERTLKWNAVENCSSYTVCLNDIIYINTSSNLCNVSSYYTELGKYTFRVKANKSDNFIESSYSDTLTDIYTKKLDKPRGLVSFNNGNNIEIFWNEVENARAYEIYINDALFNINGTSTLVETNAIILSFENLNISSIDELKNVKLQVRAIGYGYYLSSELSSNANFGSVLDAPNITNDQAKKTIYWKNNEYAKQFEVNIDGNLIYNGISLEGDICAFNYSEFVVGIGKHSLKVKAIAINDNLNSQYSNVIELTTYQQLTSPVISSVVRDSKNFIIIFDEVPHATNYKLFVNDVAINENFMQQNVLVVNSLQQSSWYNFYLIANGTGYYLNSEKSNVFGFDGLNHLSAPINIRVTNNILSWDRVDKAENYFVALDRTIYNANSSANSFNLSALIDANATYQIKVYADGEGCVKSEWSGAVIFNNVSVSLPGYTNNYFYNGRTYDYYITSQDELNAVFCYSMSNFINRFKIYIDYSPNITIYDKCTEALESFHQTMKVSYDMSNKSNAIGESNVVIIHAPITDAPTYGRAYKQYKHYFAQFTSTPRSSDYNDFAPEKSIVSQKVYTTDGLFCAVENYAKPIFVNSNSLEETVYNKAKQILRNICDDGMTDYQKAVAIHDYLVLNSSYDEYGLSIANEKTTGRYHYLEGALLDGLCVCDGYAKSFSLLCNMENILTKCINGAVDKTNILGTGHAWNKIYLATPSNDKPAWYTLDCTWDDAQDDVEKEKIEYLLHHYFMIPDSYISQRSEDIVYPISEKLDGIFYDNTFINGTSLRINTVSQLNKIKAYLNANQNVDCVEVIIKTSIFDYCYDLGIALFSYYPEENYYVAILN